MSLNRIKLHQSTIIGLVSPTCTVLRLICVWRIGEQVCSVYTNAETPRPRAKVAAGVLRTRQAPPKNILEREGEAVFSAAENEQLLWSERQPTD